MIKSTVMKHHNYIYIPLEGEVMTMQQRHSTQETMFIQGYNKQLKAPFKQANSQSTSSFSYGIMAS